LSIFSALEKECSAATLATGTDTAATCFADLEILRYAAGWLRFLKGVAPRAALEGCGR